MNNIIYAGNDITKTENLAASRKYWQIIICGGNGEIVHNKGKNAYYSGTIAVIPPLTNYKLMGANGLSYTFMELTTLPFRMPYIVKDDENGGLAHTLAQANCYFKKNDGNVLNALGNLIVAYIISLSQLNNYSPVVELVRTDINANISNSSYALDVYIRSLPLNYDYVRKLFKSETGLTPHEYLTTKRMELARQLISSHLNNTYSRYSVGQIAEMCGYAEPLYFSRVFKNYYGVSPSEYAKK